GGEHAGAEAERPADRAVRDERPCDGGHLARAVPVDPDAHRPEGPNCGARGPAAGDARAQAAWSVRHCVASRKEMALISGGTGAPKKASAVGARSTIAGSPATSGRFARMTPGVSATSEAAWSPLHFRMFVSKRSAGIPPSGVRHDVR